MNAPQVSPLAGLVSFAALLLVIFVVTFSATVVLGLLYASARGLLGLFL